MNSIYDPIALASPVILGGRWFLRKVLSTKLGKPATDLDKPLLKHFKKYWNGWLDNLKSIHLLSSPRFPQYKYNQSAEDEILFTVINDQLTSTFSPAKTSLAVETELFFILLLLNSQDFKMAKCRKNNKNVE